MKTITKKLIFLIAVFFTLYSCNEDKVLHPNLEEQNSSDDKEVAQKSDKLLEAIGFVNEYFNTSPTNSMSTNTLSHANQSVNISKQSIDNIYEIKEGDNNGKTLLKLISFNPSGYALISALESSNNPPVLFYSKGKFNKEDINPGLLLYINNFITYIEEGTLSSSEEDKDVMLVTDQEIMSNGYNNIGNRRFFKREEKKGPLLSTVWHQRSPFNDQCPIKEGRRTLVGCVAIALGQIMNYHRKNNKKHYDWNKIGSRLRTPSNNYEKARFLHDIGVGVNMDYGVQGSGTTNDYAIPYFREAGYPYANEVYYTFERVKSHIDNKKPVYLSACANRKLLSPSWLNQNRYIYTDCHAWVADGYKIITQFYRSNLSPYYNTYKLKYLHMNWGWGAAFQGEDAWCYANNWDPGSGWSFRYVKSMFTY